MCVRDRSKRITDVPGCSVYYLGGVCSYANEVKTRLLGVRKETLDTVGAVSPEVAEQMAAGVAQALGADVGVGITGVALSLIHIEMCIRDSGVSHLNRHKKGRVITTEIEHAATLNTCRQLAAEGFDVAFLAPDATGHITAAALEAALTEDTVLLSCQLVNNCLLYTSRCV